MSNFGAPPVCNFFFGNPGPYNIDFRFNNVNMPAGYSQIPQGQQQTIQYPGFYSCQGQIKGRPCDRHQNPFCNLPECRRSGLEESSSLSGYNGGSSSSSRSIYMTPTSAPNSVFGTPHQNTFETPIRGIQSLSSFHGSPNGGNDSWFSGGGGSFGTPNNSANSSSLGVFSPRNCTIS